MSDGKRKRYWLWREAMEAQIRLLTAENEELRDQLAAALDRCRRYAEMLIGRGPEIFQDQEAEAEQ